MLRSNRKSTTRRRIALFAGILLPLCGLAGTPRLGTDPLHRVMKALSLEEKAALLVGASMEDYSGEHEFRLFRKGVQGAADLVAGVQDHLIDLGGPPVRGVALAQPRVDGLHGLVEVLHHNSVGFHPLGQVIVGCIIHPKFSFP